LFMAKIAESFRHNKNFRFAMFKHEFQFTLTKYRHEWIQYSANTTTSEIQQGKFPPVRQLARHHIIFLDTQLFQAQRNFVGHVPKLLVAEGLFTLILDLKTH